MATANIFEKASRKALVFRGVKGTLRTDDLWKLSQTDLDTLYKSISTELEGNKGKGLIETVSKADADNALRLEIVTYIFNYNKAKADRKAKNALIVAEENRLLERLAANKDAAEAKLTDEEIRNRLAALRGGAIEDDED